jgi:Astacin (Peptidase family M12A)
MLEKLFEPLSAPKHSETIYEAMRMIENSTCVRFVNYTDQADFVLVTSGANACKSMVGKRGGKQIMKLVKPNGGGCFGHGKILHEFLHLLGFNHFHKSPVRDNHVRIVWENVKPGYENKFDKRSSKELTDFGTGYDFDSLVHPSNTTYSKNGKITIETADPKDSVNMGQRKKLSDGDIMRINRMYKCDETNSQNKTLQLK